MVKVLREEINWELMQFEAETYGELHLMPRGAERVFAIFGAFERTRNRTLLYTSSIPDDWARHYKSEHDLLDSLDSEYLDDLRALKTGNVDVYN